MATPVPAQITIKPAPGRIVRLESGRKLTPENCFDGVSTPWSLFLQRRLNCGDLVMVPTPAAPATPGIAAAKPAGKPADTKGDAA